MPRLPKPHRRTCSPLQPVADPALFRIGIPHVLVSDGRCGSPKSLSFFRLTCSFICSMLNESKIFSVIEKQGGLAIWLGYPMRLPKGVLFGHTEGTALILR